MSNFLKKFNAFFERDIKIALSYKFNLLIQAIYIAIFFIVIYFSFKGSDLENSALSYLNVFLSLISIDFMFSSLNVFSREVRNAKTLGTFESFLLTNTPFFTIIFSTYALTLFRMLFRSLIYLLVCKYFFYYDISQLEILVVILSLLFNSIPFIGLGLISASIIIIFKFGDISSFLIALISIFFSGIFFPINSLPIFMQSFGEITPLNICLETAKKILDANSLFIDIIPYLRITIIEILLFFPLGVFLIKLALRKAKKDGSLNFY